MPRAGRRRARLGPDEPEGPPRGRIRPGARSAEGSQVSSLQLGLVVAGVLLVVGVILFNRWQERRIRQRIDAAFASGRDKAQASDARVEPTLRGSAESRVVPAATATAP